MVYVARRSQKGGSRPNPGRSEEPDKSKTREVTMDIGIIGAGIAGLTAAYELTQKGHDVVIYETRPYTGGLSAGFRDRRWSWYLDRFYHHWFATDEDVIKLIEELGARDKMFFPWPTTSLYYQGQIYPLDSPIPWLKFIPLTQLHRAIRVFQFKPLPLLDRLRFGLGAFYLTLTKNWQSLEQISAEAWLREKVGRRAYEMMWKPLLISKFGEEHYQEVNMAWMWARAYKRSARLGYFEGGFQAFVDLLAERVQAQGGIIRLGTPVRAIHPTEDRHLLIESAAGQSVHEHVIATCAPQEMRRITPDFPPPYVAQLDNLKSMGALVLILALKYSLTDDHYWINIPVSEGLPFMGLVEHTNYVSPTHYGGDRIVYCGDYLPPDHAYFDYTKEQLFETYLPGLTKINPNFRPDWVRASWKFTESYAQPIP
ncbi:MAG TPA: FAD-dependent oxidoreductase, partial [Chloroflexi bacterium]|nr:FAD-dependent oxidoreductase [Chloroflexota bacterium]